MEIVENVIKERYGKTLTGLTNFQKAALGGLNILSLLKRKERYLVELKNADGKESTNLLIKISSIEEVITEKQKE